MIDQDNVKQIERSYMYEKLFEGGISGYTKLLSSEMFFELFPELCGDYTTDLLKLREAGYEL